MTANPSPLDLPKPSVTPAIGRVIEAVEADSVFDFHALAPPDYAAKLGIGCDRVDGVTLACSSGSNSLSFNRAQGLDC